MKKVFVNGNVYLGNNQLSQGFVTENGKFIKVGSTNELKASFPNDEIIDLQGKFVCAGFDDSHMHLLNYGQFLDLCDLTNHTKSISELKQALRDFIKEKNILPGTWVRGRGFNQDLFCDFNGMPTRQELDEVSKEHPVMTVRCCGHLVSLNTMALKMCGITRDTPNVLGGTIEHDEFGEPNGIIVDNALSMVYNCLPVPDKAAVKNMIYSACKAYNSVGVTSCHSDDFTSIDGVDYKTVMEAYDELKKENKLTLRVYEQSQFLNAKDLREFLDAGFNTGYGDEYFKIGPLKIIGDGSLGARSAYLSNDYLGMPGERGLLIYTPEEFYELISLAHKSSMQVAVHVIGDGTLDVILDCYEKAFKECPRDDHRSGIVHCQITRPDQLEKMAKLNMHIYAQTIFIDYDSRIVEKTVGKELASTSYAFKKLGKMGLSVSNGTDCPVEDPNPMRGLQCAVTRQPLDLSLPPYVIEEQMTVAEALDSYTIKSAEASFEEHIKGQIKEGFYADFTVLSESPFSVAPQKIQEIKVLATYLNGEKVY